MLGLFGTVQTKVDTPKLKELGFITKLGGDTRIEVVAKQDINKKWIILSVWSKQIFPSSKNNKSDRSGLLTRILELFRVKYGR